MMEMLFFRRKKKFCRFCEILKKDRFKEDNPNKRVKPLEKKFLIIFNGKLPKEQWLA